MKSCKNCKHSGPPQGQHGPQSKIEHFYCDIKGFDVPGYYHCDSFEEKEK